MALWIKKVKFVIELIHKYRGKTLTKYKTINKTNQNM
jgi:hypothetical protein